MWYWHVSVKTSLINTSVLHVVLNWTLNVITFLLRFYLLKQKSKVYRIWPTYSMKSVKYMYSDACIYLSVSYISIAICQWSLCFLELGVPPPPKRDPHTSLSKRRMSRSFESDLDKLGLRGIKKAYIKHVSHFIFISSFLSPFLCTCFYYLTFLGSNMWLWAWFTFLSGYFMRIFNFWDLKSISCYWYHNYNH